MKRMTEGEMESFERYARQNDTDAFGDQEQWADYTLRLIAEVRESRAIPLPEANIGARYCAKCFGLLVDASGHVLNEHVRGCKGDDWPVASKWLVLTDSTANPLPEDVAEITDGIQDHIDKYRRDGRFIGCTAGCVVCRNSEQIIAALETQSRERAVLAEGFKAIMQYQGSGATKQLYQSLYLTADWDAIQAALVLIEGEKGEG